MADCRATFGDVEARSARLARQLLAAGVGKATRVGLHFPYCPEFLIAFLAVTGIGALAVSFSTAYAQGELRRRLPRTDVHTLLVPAQMFGTDELAYLAGAVPTLAEQGAEPLMAGLLHLPNIWTLGASGRPWAISADVAHDASSVDEAMLQAAEANVSPGD